MGAPGETNAGAFQSPPATAATPTGPMDGLSRQLEPGAHSRMLAHQNRPLRQEAALAVANEHGLWRRG